MNISFVILHYQNYEVTMKCISYLKQLDKFSEINVIVVDNCSPNNSGDKIKEQLDNEKNFHLLKTEYNMGFAKGNNLGYLYAKKELSADIIIVMNNDVFIKDKDFINKLLLKSKENESIHLLAPNIINLDGMQQNPFRLKPLDKKYLTKMYLYNKSLNILYSIPALNFILATILKKRKKEKIKVVQSYNKEMTNILPHGACIIYLKNWIKNEDFAFIPETFMYFEEDILFYYLSKKNYILKYYPDLIVEHIEDASVDSSAKNEIAKRKFIAKNLSNSIKIYFNISKNQY